MSKNEKEEEIKPIIFQNKPITSEEQDLFDYSYQKQVLDSAIDSDARIIGIIGDYGTGKSSITKLLENSRRKKHDKIVNINLWGQFSKKSQDTKETDPLLKSFLYQLAYANNKWNDHFARYINARFNKNNGKIGFSIATRKIFFLLFFAALFILLFFTFNTIEIPILSITDKEKFFKANLWEQILTVLSYTRYFLLVIGFSFITWAISLASPAFTSWKSEGNYTPDNSDIYDIYLKIIKRLSHLAILKKLYLKLRKIQNRNSCKCY